MAERGQQQGSQRGFAQDPERAAEAGRKAHEMGTAHEFDSDEARSAAEKRNRNR